MSDTGRRIILIVEDDAVTRHVLRKLFESESDLKTVEVADGQTAWKLLEAGLKPDLCLLDVSLPDIDGLSLLRKVRSSEKHRELSVILCTAAHDRDTIQRAAGLAIRYYVVKPFRRELLLTQVRQALAGSRKEPAPVAVEPPKMTAPLLVQHLEKLPSLPLIYQELVQALGRSDSSLSRVSEIFLRDPCLTLRLLKLANSVFYGSNQIMTIESAIQLVGLEQIQDLATHTPVLKRFENACDAYVDPAAFLRHSLGCAAAGALLSECRRDPSPERLFIGGLLHDIGRFVMFVQAPEQSRKILQRCQDEGSLSLRVERDVLGFDHAMLGAELAMQWNLPKPFVDMIAFHHAPTKSSTGLPSDSFLIHYADFLCTALALGDSGEMVAAPLVVPGKTEQVFLDNHPVERLVTQLEIRYEALCRRLFSEEEALVAA